MAANEHDRGGNAIGRAEDAASAAARPLSEAEQRQIRVLKAVVISLGVLIVVGLIVLLTAVVMRGGGGSRALPAEKAMHVPLPKGAVVEEMRLSGNVLALRIRRADGGREVIVIDAKRGHVIRRVRLGP